MAFAVSRKIDPSKATDKMPITAGLPSSVSYQARAEWREAGLIEPNCEAIRDYRLGRLQAQIDTAGVGALLMFDPMNIRYATDSTNMILWNHHNPFRAVLLCADGHLVLWDYRNTEFLTEDNPEFTNAEQARTSFILIEATVSAIPQPNLPGKSNHC